MICPHTKGSPFSSQNSHSPKGRACLKTGLDFSRTAVVNRQVEGTSARPRLAVFRSRMHMQLPHLQNILKKSMSQRQVRLTGVVLVEIWNADLRCQRHALVVDDTIGTGVTMVHVLHSVLLFFYHKGGVHMYCTFSFQGNLQASWIAGEDSIQAGQAS